MSRFRHTQETNLQSEVQAEIVERQSKGGAKYGVLVKVPTYSYAFLGEPALRYAGYDRNSAPAIYGMDPMWANERADAQKLLELVLAAGFKPEDHTPVDY